MTALAAWVVLRQRLRGDLALALAVGAAGAVWVIFRGEPGRLMALEVGRGEAIYLFGCALHALFTPLMRRWNRGEPPLVSTSLVMGSGFLVLLAYGWMDLMATDFAALPARVWLGLAYLVVFASAVAILLLQYGNQRLPASKVMAYSYLTPAWVLLIDLGLGRALPEMAVLPGLGLILLTQVLLLRED
jgi:drug/metabolite transporter (DMT)-like permease